jgi:hypothetical protein
MIAPSNRYIVVLDTCVLAPMPLCDTPAQADRRITAMECAFEDASVTGYECLVASMTNDPKDRHVLAAAVRCGAHAIGVLTPDDFLVHQFHLNQDLLAEKVVAQALARGVSLADLLARLSKWAPGAAELIADLG